MNLPLHDLRAEIDRIDDALHDLLMQRAAIVGRVAQRKQADRTAPGLRPGREAAILRRLLGRHHGALPSASVAQLWREVLAGSLSMQGPFTVAIAAPTLAATAQAHFGALTCLQTCTNPLAALAALRTGAAAVAVLPDDPAALAPLLLQSPRLHIIARLPFVPMQAATPCLVAAASPPDPSGDDVSLIATCIDTTWQITRQQGLSPDAILPDGSHLLGAYARPLQPPGPA